MTEKDRVFWPTKKGLFNPTLPLAFNLLIGVKASNFTGSRRPLCGVLNYAELSSCERVNAKTAGILLAHELCIIITAFLEIVSMRPALDNGQLLPLVPGAWQVRELSWINLPRHTYEWSLDSHGLTTMQRR